jgi:radical SAM superfamily enzyme YgiQ (UPF0313 family)
MPQKNNVLFFVPPAIRYEDFVHPTSNARFKSKNGKMFGNVLADMPIGVLSLSAYIKKFHTINSKLIDFNIVLNKISDFNYDSFKYFFKDIIFDYNDFDPEYICISALFSPAYQNMIDIANVCREIFPNSFILGGGALPTNMYEDVFNQTNSFDALCYGEGEIPLSNLISAQNKKVFLEQNTSWITTKKIKNNSIFEKTFIINLDEIPFYDYDLCNVDDYGISPAIIAYSAVEEKTQNYHVMTSRGCPFHCTFCSSHTVHDRKMRYFSIDRVKEDFLKLKNNYGAHTFVIQDDHFLQDKKRALKIIDIIKELKMKVVFQNGLALYSLTRDILEAIKDAGVNHLVLAVESGSQRVLKELMHKPLTLEIIERVASDCRELGIYTDVNLIIGMPGETKQDLEEARKFLKKIPTNWFRITVATPLVGSELYSTCIEKGYIKKSFADSHYKKAVIETDDFTPEWIENMQYFMNLELNFVENSDFKYGNYNDALNGFLNVIKAKGDHAFAFYFASKCYNKLGDAIKEKEFLDIAKKIVSTNFFWGNYNNMFNLNII